MKRIAYLVSLALILLASCDDTTGIIGTDVMPSIDNIDTDTASFAVTSRTVRIDSVLANTSTCYMGSIIDPETQSKTTCGFLAQFHLLEDFGLPDISRMVKDGSGQAVCDSCELSLFFDTYYGDSLVAMNMLVEELDANNTMQENKLYYTSLKADDYISKAADAIRIKKTYSLKDMSRENAFTGQGSTNYSRISVKLPVSYGQKVLNAYYEHPEYFKNSYTFIKNICPGFSFKSIGGTGSLVKVAVSTLDFYFKYQEEDKDTIVVGIKRMAATEEVLQNTTVTNDNVSSLLGDNPYTIVKSPSTVFTEVTLPISEIISTQHENDTINSAQIFFRRYNSSDYESQLFSVPDYLLMVKKSEMKEFFEKNKLPDSNTSFLSVFSQNSYAFNNIARMINALAKERDTKAGVLPTDNDTQRALKRATWEAANPDWNKVLLVPVTPEYTTTTSYYGTVQKTLVRLRNNLDLTSVKIEGGSKYAPSISVIYSHFDK